MEVQPGPWQDYQRPPPTPAAPRIVVPVQPQPRTPEQVTIQRGQAEAAPLEAPKTQAELDRIRQQTQQTNTGGANFQDENALRTQYLQRPEIQNYQSVLPMVNAARQAAPGGAGDLQVVYAFAKVMDPGSVVREGEVQMSQGTGGLGEQIRGYVQSLSNGGRLTPTVRQRLLTEIQTRSDQYRAAYNQTRKDYWQRAERYRFDPESIIGHDLEAAYEPGTNAPQIPAPPRASPIDAIGSTVGADLPPAVDQVTRTNPQESAQASQVAVEGEEDTSGTAQNPRYVTPEDRQWNQQWTAAVNGGATREQLNQLSTSTGHIPLDDATWQLIQDSRHGARGLNWQPVPTGVNNEEYQDQAERRRGAAAREEWGGEHPYLAALDTGVRTIANAVTLGGADQAAGALGGQGAAFEHGVTQQDWTERPVISLGGTMAGGAMLPYGGSIPRQLGLGGAYGAATGFNESDGQFGDRLGNAYRGGATGLATNAVGAGLGRAFRAPNADDILQAGERQGIEIPRYMLGRETAQVATGAVGATPGRIPLAGAARRAMEGIEAARSRTASEIGDVGDNVSAGRRAQSGAREWLDTSEQRGAQHFDRIPIPPRTQASLDHTRAVLADVTQGLESNPRLSGLLEDPQLIRFRDALAEGGLSWGDMKQFRTVVGRMIGRAQVASEGTHVQDLRALYSGLTQDMEATAAAQGPRALTMFRRANQYWRGREARRDGVIQDILGRNMDAAPEDAYRQINRWAQRDRGDIQALTQTMRSLPRDDANAVRATIFARMGRATSGQQDETGEAFSPFVFATQWSGLEPRAKALLVPNRSHRRSLDDIALLATSMRRSERFTNTSNTGLGANLGMFTLGGMANLPAAGGAAALTYTLGRLLSTPAGSATFLRALRNPESFSGILQGEDEEPTGGMR